MLIINVFTVIFGQLNVSSPNENINLTEKIKMPITLFEKCQYMQSVCVCACLCACLCVCVCERVCVCECV